MAKVEDGSAVDYKLVWKRLDNPGIDSDVRNVMFLLIHNKLPVTERLFRIGVKVDPYCSHCPGAEVDDVEHFVCYCVRTRQCWSWIRLTISELCGQGSCPRPSLSRECCGLLGVMCTMLGNIAMLDIQVFGWKSSLDS